jgi:hypothetical protein
LPDQVGHGDHGGGVNLGGWSVAQHEEGVGLYRRSPMRAVRFVAPMLLVSRDNALRARAQIAAVRGPSLGYLGAAALAGTPPGRWLSGLVWPDPPSALDPALTRKGAIDLDADSPKRRVKSGKRLTYDRALAIRAPPCAIIPRL